MKKTIIIITLIITNLISGQEIIIPIQNKLNDNHDIEDIIYFKDSNNLLNKFVGEWEFSDQINYLKITITKQLHVSRSASNLYNDNDFEDLIFVKILFKQNDIIKYNNIEVMRGNLIVNSNTIHLTYHEPSLITCYRAKTASLELKVINYDDPFTTNQIIWTRTNKPIINRNKCLNGSELDETNFLIPENLILSKI